MKSLPPLAIYCKSYSTDLRRVVRLAQSVAQYNRQDLPFYVSVPAAELPLFREHLAGLPAQLLCDDDIMAASPRTDRQALQSMSGSLAQQVIKSEFWRLNLSEAYLCIDSDSLFIRPFGLQDFLANDGVPYTLIDLGQDLLNDALTQGKTRVVEAFEREAAQVQTLFGRTGKAYSFGPFPLVWHRSVWESLDQSYLAPRGMSFADAIRQAPIESRWYGEALLKFQAIPLHPCQQFFKVYHYAWQYDRDVRHGIDAQALARLYCGVIYQSSWEREMDWPSEGGHWGSRLGRRLRRRLGRI